MYTSEDQLHTKDKASEVESNRFKGLFVAAGILKRSYEVRSIRGENDASDQGYDLEKAISEAAGIMRDCMILQGTIAPHSRET